MKSIFHYLIALIYISLPAMRLMAQTEIQSSNDTMHKKMLTNYTGVYAVRPHEKDSHKACRYFFSKGDTLFAQPKGGCKDALVEVSNDLFVFRNGGPYYQFHRNKNGSVRSLEMYDNPDQYTPHQLEFKTALALPKEKHPVVIDAAKLSLLKGKYDFGGGFLVFISVEGNKVYMEIPGEEKEEIFAENEIGFFEKKVDGTVEFIKQNGQVVRMIIRRDEKYEGKKID
jgi:hypothetical protein